MTEPITAAVQQAEETEQQIVAVCKELMSKIEDCKWGIGRLANDWTKRFAAGRTDEDFGKLIGLSRQQVQARRETWAQFGDVCHTYCNLSWSHFVVVRTWPDAEEWLAEADKHRWPVAMMTNMRSVRERMDRGEDLTQPAGGDGCDGGDEDGPAEGPDDEDHVGDVDPYQKPRSIVKPTPRDFPVEPEPPAKPVPRDELGDVLTAIRKAVKLIRGDSDRQRFAGELRRMADEIEGTN